MRPFLIRAFAIVFFLLTVAAFAADTAPNLDFHDLQGAPHKLEDYRGKPVVLNFWATWCVPCAAEMPLLNEMQNRYKGKAVFIAASVDDDDMKAAVQSFIKKHQGTDLSVMMGATLESLHDFGLEDVMPGTVFIDSDGNIVDRLSGALKRPDLEQRMLKLAGQPAALPPARKAAKKRSTK
jgi:thiol-disulfide isomerase/thioredoxin